MADYWRHLEAPREATALRLELATGSRVISLLGSEETVRGYSSVDLLVVDEAARVGDDLYAGVRPMLAVSGGRLIALSTPTGKQGWFYRAWTEGGADWERVLVRASDCPRISARFLEGERLALGERWYLQEYECEFVDLESAVFGADLLRRAIDPGVKPLFVGG